MGVRTFQPTDDSKVIYWISISSIGHIFILFTSLKVKKVFMVHGFALHTNVPWTNWPNPGQIPMTNDAWTLDQSRTARTIYTANKLCWDSESNIRRATNAELNVAIPRTIS